MYFQTDLPSAALAHSSLVGLKSTRQERKRKNKLAAESITGSKLVPVDGGSSTLGQANR